MLYSFTSLNNALLIEIQLLKSDARARWPWSWKWKTSYWRARARSPLTPSRRRLARGARAAGRRGEPGRLALGRARQDGTRRWAADSPAPASLVARRGALPPTHIGVHVRRHARLGRCARIPPSPLYLAPVSLAPLSASLRRRRAAHHPTDPLIRPTATPTPQ